MPLRYGKCDQPGCTTPEGHCIAKNLPSSGRWCHACNQRRLGVKGRKDKEDISKAQLKEIVKELDKVFALYVKQRDADEHGIASCATCGKREHWEDMDCGHCEERGNLSIRWDERNVAAQCRYPCNRGDGKGEKEKFKAYIERRYGQGTCEELKALTRKPFKLERLTLLNLIKKYS
jgi:hypothetical protein